jgi:FdhD protein
MSGSPDDESALASLPVITVEGSTARTRTDVVVVEAPLELHVRLGDGPERRFTVTLRTPGQDEDLALGLLFAEGIVRSADDVLGVRRLDPNVLRVDLAAHVQIPDALAERRQPASAACGACGKTSLQALHFEPAAPLLPAGRRIPPAVLHALPARSREAQNRFEATGGLHAAAMFTFEGTLLDAREDVGRHNAVDKLIGGRLRAGTPHAPEGILFLSGRAGFELVQKALMARIPVVASVGAPSSLAVELARQAGLTLVGFLRGDRFNVYAGAARLDVLL